VTINDAFNEYMKTADQCKEDPIVNEVIEELKKPMIPDSPTPFIFLDGSSGMGKTQMVFNLMQRNIPVIYFLCRELGESTQPIYECFHKRSRFFLKLVRQDLEKIESTSYDLLQLQSKPLAIYGLLFTILQTEISKWNEEMTFQTTTKQQLEQRIKTMREKGKFPVIFLDEFPPLLERSGISNMNELKLMRNVFRVLGFRVIVSSTCSSAANLIKPGQESYAGNACLWCTIFPRFPSFRCDSITNLPAWLRYLIQNSRPRFCRFALEYWQQQQTSSEELTLDGLAKFVWQRGTNKRNRTDFLHGQACLFLTASFQDIQDINSVFVEGHYANLVENERFELNLAISGLEKKEEGISWYPTVTFLSFEEDLLVYLSMMGGKEMLAFQSKDKHRMRYVDAISSLETVARQWKIIYKNSKQETNDGMLLEALVAAVIVLASHADGFKGIAVDRFLY